MDTPGLAVRAELATRWTEVALMEHASIAAFARFALEILSLGAPPELLVQTHAAMTDETVHARDAFALASAYAGRAVGPGALDVGAALSSRTPLDIVRTTILEGCIGETVAAVEAAEAREHATDAPPCAPRSNASSWTRRNTRSSRGNSSSGCSSTVTPSSRKEAATCLVELSSTRRLPPVETAP